MIRSALRFLLVLFWGMPRRYGCLFVLVVIGTATVAPLIIVSLTSHILSS